MPLNSLSLSLCVSLSPPRLLHLFGMHSRILTCDKTMSQSFPTGSLLSLVILLLSGSVCARQSRITIAMRISSRRFGPSFLLNTATCLLASQSLRKGMECVWRNDRTLLCCSNFFSFFFLFVSFFSCLRRSIGTRLRLTERDNALGSCWFVVRNR